MKTQICLEKEDLTLKVKIKDEDEPDNITKWEIVKLDEFGPISELDMDRSWNPIRVLPISSPPKGRIQYQTLNPEKESSEEPSKESSKHNLSLSSSEEDSPKKSRNAEMQKRMGGKRINPCRKIKRRSY